MGGKVPSSLRGLEDLERARMKPIGNLKEGSLWTIFGSSGCSFL